MKLKVSAGIENVEGEVEGTLKEAQGSLKSIIPDFVTEGMGILTDTCKSWRFKNQVKIIEKAHKTVKESGLSAQQVPMKLLLPILENGSLEEEESMQQKWANLLANAATDNSKEVHIGFPEILKNLSPLEVKLLDGLYERNLREKRTDWEATVFIKEQICIDLGINLQTLCLIVDNFSRLGIARYAYTQKFDVPIGKEKADGFAITDLGLAFIKACREIPKQETPPAKTT